jgi:hypothetical protein
MSLPEIVITVEEEGALIIVQDGCETVPAPTPDAYAHRFLMTAGVTLSGHRAVISDNGIATYASQNNPAHDGKLAGITMGAALEGDTVTVHALGLLTEPTWSFTPGAIWLGENGVITQTKPVTGLLWRLGTALTPTTILWKPDLPIHQ